MWISSQTISYLDALELYWVWTKKHVQAKYLGIKNTKKCLFAFAIESTIFYRALTYNS